MTPTQLLTQKSLTYVADRIYRQHLVEHHNPKLPELKPVHEDPTGQVLWDYLLETNTLPEVLHARAQYSQQPNSVHRWFVLDAIWSAIACHTWDHPVYRGDRMIEARKLLGVLLHPNYENRTPFTGTYASVQNIRHGCQEILSLKKLSEHFYVQQITVFAHACAAGSVERPYDKAVMAYAALSGHPQASRARRRLNLMLQLHEHVPDPWEIAVAQGIFPDVLTKSQTGVQNPQAES